MVNRFIGRVRSPVRRGGSERYLLITLLSFAASVALTRLFLELTGYPQIGGGELHIAHVLWGGLLLFAAALLPLVFANRWVYSSGALLAGLGVGLFIDEVGKFITQSNDYFHPAAAPIVYAFFLLTVLIYLQVRRPPKTDARGELYRSIGALMEVLDHDLEPSERLTLKFRLRRVADTADHSDLANLAQALLEFLESDALHLAPETPSFVERLLMRLRDFESRWLTERRIKAALVGGLGALGVMALIDLAQLLLAARNPLALERMVAEVVALGKVASSSGIFWFAARVTLEGLVGLLIVLAAGLLVAGRDERGIALGSLALLLSLAAVNLLVFYFEQFSTILKAMIQFSLLLGVFYYRRRHLTPQVIMGLEIDERQG
jgi:hypothetical protein